MCELNHGSHLTRTRYLIMGDAVPSSTGSGLAGRLLATLYPKFDPIRHDACVD